MVVGQKFEFAYPELTILNGKISITILCKLTQLEENSFAHALMSVEKQLKDENISVVQRVNIVFSLEDEVTLKLEDDVLGTCIPPLIIYPVKRWRDKNMQGNILIPIMLEELCHCFWQEVDEVKVKYIVARVMRNIETFKDLTVHDIYNKIYELYNKS